MADRYFCMSNADAVKQGLVADSSVPEFGWSIFRHNESGSTHLVGSDGGEPEDQLLVRDWSWVLDALNAEAHARDAEIEAFKRGAEQMHLLSLLPLPREVVAVIQAAKEVVAAAEACDREARRPKPSRSTAPIVRSIDAMNRLRAALRALDRKPAK